LKGDKIVRILSYRLELDYDDGYVISNASPVFGCRNNTPAEMELSGIKMTILNLPDEQNTEVNASWSAEESSLDEFLTQFEFVEDNWKNPEFRACYRRLLLGEETGWKLVHIKVSYGYLWLDFANEQRYHDLMKNGDADAKSPYYLESIRFMPHEDCGGLFRFDVERPDGMVETYEMSIEKAGTYIKEQIGSQKRIVCFEDTNDEESQWINVQSYC